MTGYLDAVTSGVVILDGATGTNLQRRNLTVEDYGGPEFEGCVDLLSVTRPDVIEDLHRSFLDVSTGTGKTVHLIFARQNEI